MADSAFGLERSIDPTTYSPVISVDRGNGDRAPVSGSPMGGPDATHAEIESLVRLGTRKQENGESSEAEEYFGKALDLADGAFGPDNPELMLLLTDLTRLYLRNSSFAAAEPLLLRLLDMKRSKGEDHPEVATVLASLANVRESLGRHESAEQLWRRVLEIRERTLAPNHFAIATALEHLGCACAARGKNSEALGVLQRALSIRELTLGAEHPSLRVSRERIADLQLQAEDSFDTGGASEGTIAPERYRLGSGEAPTSMALSPATADRIPTSPPRKPSVVIRGRLADLNPEDAWPTRTQSAKTSAPSVLADIAPVSASTESAGYRDVLESLREELEKPYEPAAFTERGGALLASVLAFLNKKQVIAALVIVVLSLVAIGVVTDSHAFGESQTTALAATTNTPPTSTPPAVVTNAVATTSDASNAPTTNSGGSKSAPAHTRPAEDRPAASKKAPEKKPESKIAIPTLSKAVMSRLDEVASNTSASARTGDIQPPTPAIVSTRRSFEDTEAPSAPLRARLIGDLPTPRVPDQVADVEGEVRVRFNVDTDGRPMMSTFSVVNSPNPLLTNAVRKVIPGMRFEPARTGGADSRAIVDVVQIGFQFARR